MTLRLTSQKAVEVVGNRFDLVLMASQRTRELKEGSMPRVDPEKTHSSTALKEIEEGKYTKKDYLRKIVSKKRKGHRDEYYPS